MPSAKEGYGLLFLAYPRAPGYKFQILVNGKAAAGHLRKNSYVYAYLPPGDHVLIARAATDPPDTPSLRISIERGQTYYVRLVHVRRIKSTTPARQAMGMGPLLKDSFRLEQVSEEIGQRILRSLR